MRTPVLAMFVLGLSQVLAVVGGLIVAAMGFGGLFTAQNASTENAGTALVLTGGALMGIAVLVFVLGFVAGFGLRGGKAWARKLADIAAWWWKRGRLG